MSQFEASYLGGGIGASEFEQYSTSGAGQRHRRPASIPAEAWEATREPQQNVGETERLVSAAAGLGLAAIGLARGKLSGLALLAVGGGLLYRGITGRCQCYAALGINTAERNPATGVPAQRGCKVEKTLVIHRPAHELYQYWRRLENLPRFMRHLKRVEAHDQQRSHWVAEGVLGKEVEWDAEIINEREHELIAWRSLPGGDIDTAGSVHFKPLPNERGTEVTVSMKYNPPAGKLGEQIASMLGDGLDAKLEEDLHRFKTEMESGKAEHTTTMPR